MADNERGELARYEATLRRQEMEWQANFDRVLHSDRAAVDLGIGVLRTAVLINAGALVALLAFAAQLLKDGEHQVSSRTLTAGIPFGIGVATAALAFIIAYLYQSAFTRKQLRNLEELSTEPKNLPSIRWVNRIETVSKVLMLVLTTVSIGAFLFGMFGEMALFRGF